MKTVLFGSVISSRIVLQELIAAGSPPEMVFSLDEAYSEGVSGYYPIHKIAAEHGIPYRTFKKISEPECMEAVRKIQPDYIFVVGLSQIVDHSIIDAAKRGVVGLHPTPLPKFRGRAAMVWQVLLDVRETAISLFLIDEGMDSGPILGQEPYTIGENDYAVDVERNCMEALQRLCRRVIPQLQNDTLQPVVQNEAEATYLLKRTPEDGVIDWNLPMKEIHRLIRAVSHPYPGAFSHYDGKHLITIWRADMEENTKYIGIPGQIAELTEDGFAVVCRDGLLRVTEFTCEDTFRMFVGHRLRQKGDIR